MFYRRYDKNMLVCFFSSQCRFRFLAALRKKSRFTVFGICLCSATKMLTHGTVTAVDSLVLFQTSGTETNFVVDFNGAFIVIF